MDGVTQNNTGILVIGATNRPESLDPAFRRRFQKKIYIPLPDYDARKALFQKKIGNTRCSLLEEDFSELARKTGGFSGSDITNLVQVALNEPIKKIAEAEYFHTISVRPLP
jgi:vacuolar protein-sorting-associated protein 4